MPLCIGFGHIDLSTMGRFDYNGGHMQKHATLMGLGPLGADWSFGYGQPQLASGRSTSAAGLQISKLLGTHAVCTNPATCSDAVHTPIPSTESWHYSVGHWVEDDRRGGRWLVQQPGRLWLLPLD